MNYDEENVENEENDFPVEVNYFSINNCYDCEGNFDFERYEDAIMDGEYVDDF